jgi:hypothetical protein
MIPAKNSDRKYIMLWRAAKVIHMETEIFALSAAVSTEDGERAGGKSHGEHNDDLISIMHF